MVRKSEMFREERLQLILRRLLAEKRVYVADLAEGFRLSRSTIRKDLAELESRGVLVRTYRGAMLPEQSHATRIGGAPARKLREQSQRAEKTAIGWAAADLVTDGDTIMIDGGSTTSHVVRNLVSKRGLTIITNAASLLSDLLAIEDAEVYATGGLLRRDGMTFVGEIADDMVMRFHTHKAILGMDGVSIRCGLTGTHPTMAFGKRRMINASEQLIVVCDHTKLEKVSLVPIAALEAMDYLVTDSNADPDIVDAIRERGPEVIVAPVGKRQAECRGSRY